MFFHLSFEKTLFNYFLRIHKLVTVNDIVSDLVRDLATDVIHDLVNDLVNTIVNDLVKISYQ